MSGGDFFLGLGLVTLWQGAPWWVYGVCFAIAAFEVAAALGSD